MAGLPKPAPDQPSSHEDDYFWVSLRTPRTPGLLDRQGPQQEWQLLHIQSAKDGHVRRIHQCAVGSRLNQHIAEGVCWPDQLEGQDPPDPR